MSHKQSWAAVALVLVFAMVIGGYAPVAASAPAQTAVVSSTVPVTTSGAVTSTAPMTSTGAVTSTVPMTSTGAVTSTVPVTATTTQTTTSGAPFVFGVILVGPYNDHGWSEANYDAGQYAEAKIPGAKMVYVDNVNPASKPGVTVPQVVDSLISQGAKIVFATSDDFQDGALEAAKAHPDLPIVEESGDQAWKDGQNYQAPPNESNFMGRAEYSKMIGGCAAALTTQTGKIGFLGPLINDETRRLADAAFLGARYCWQTYAKKDPSKLQFKVTWIGYWFNIPGQTLDPTKVADDFFNNGYDVVMSGIDTTEALVEAGKMTQAGKKVWAVPYDFKDACAEAPSVCLGVPYYNWGPAYVKAIQMVQNNQWTQFWNWNGPDWSDYDNADTSNVGFAFGDALSADTKATLQTLMTGMGNGSIVLFKGPLNYQDGSVYLKDGQIPTDQQIWYMPQLLQGMVGQSK